MCGVPGFDVPEYNVNFLAASELVGSFGLTMTYHKRGSADSAAVHDYHTVSAVDSFQNDVFDVDRLAAPSESRHNKEYF